MTDRRDNSIRALLRRSIEQLRSAQVSSFTLAAELLLLHATGRDRTWIYSHPEEIVPDGTTDRFFELIRRRASGEPTQHLTGKQEFWGLEFEVSPDVLIPRPETEHLVEVALDRLAVREVRAGRDPRLTGRGVEIVDVGTGSGCIAIALAKELPEAQVYATDISAKALRLARKNAARHGFENRIRFFESNLLASLSSLEFDLITSNPPYIALGEADSLPVEVRRYEPTEALFGGPEGYELYGDLVLQAARQLKPEGLVVLELGHNSLPAVRPLFDSSEWTNIGVTRDLAGIDRVLSAERLP
ncbi:MAG: peptide chain release factor N(5)-glutamine methyltransferase [Candidatus Acidiferrum sp.]